jgi:transposase
MLGIKARPPGGPGDESLEFLVPADDFYRHLQAALDLGFVRDLVGDRYAAGGRPSVDPVVYFKLQLVRFFEGLRSERQLRRHAADRVSVRWYLGYGLHERLPDHSSLTKIRQRLGLAVFQRFFEHVVELCRAAGLVWGRELFVDATQVRANAAVGSLVPRFYWRWATARRPGPAPAAAAPAAAGPRPLPVALSPAQRRHLAAAHRARWSLLDECRLDPDRPPNSAYQRRADWQVSATDPDAALMNRHHLAGTARLGYHTHYVVDGGTARVILAALVTPADVMEQTALPDLVWRVCFRWRLRPRRLVGDSAYGTTENVRALEAAGIRAYVPLRDPHAHSPLFGQGDFAYDPARDVYTCPQGTELPFRGEQDAGRVRLYQAPAAACRACPVRARCTDNPRGRGLRRSVDEAYRERVRGYHATPGYAKAMRKRAVWVEPLFGEAKDWHGLRRFRLRGLVGVNIEGLLVAAGQNLKRLLRARGWRRRPWPPGSAGQRARQAAACGRARRALAPCRRTRRGRLGAGHLHQPSSTP